MVTIKSMSGTVEVGGGVISDGKGRGAWNPIPTTKRGARRHKARSQEQKDRAIKAWRHQ